MTFALKKDYLKNWDLHQIDENPIVDMEYDDDQDIYISERSSVASSNDLTHLSSRTSKQLLTPRTPSLPPLLPKQPHTLRYAYNELPENGIPMAIQYQQQKKEEKQKQKNIHKVPQGQGNLIPFPEAKPPESGDNYYPYWYYSKVKNPDWIMRPRQTKDGQVIPFESIDPSQYAQQPALTTSPIKPRQQPRKTRHSNVSINQDKQRFEHLENHSLVSTRVTPPEIHENNYQKQKPSPKSSILGKDVDHDEHQIQPIKRTSLQQRQKGKIENDWTDNYGQSISNGKSLHESNSLVITPNVLATRPKNRAKIPDKNSTLCDLDENSKHHHHHHHKQAHNSLSIPSQQMHHHSHHHQSHIRRRPPSGAYLGSEFQVVDVSFKKPERPVYGSPSRDPFYSPIPPVSTNTPHLPLIMRDHHHHYQHKTHTSRFPSEYYGTLARQTHGNDWEETIDIPKMYKPDSQTRFYDHYPYNIVDKRLAA